MSTVFVIEDDLAYREALVRALQRRGFEATGHAGLLAAAEALGAHEPDFALVDLKLEDGSGIDALREIAARAPRCRTVMISGHGSIATAVEAMRAGAVDFLTKPVSTDRVVRSLLEAPAPTAHAEAEVTLEEVERAHIERVLASCAGNVSLAARRLGVHRRTLQRKLQRVDE